MPKKTRATKMQLARKPAGKPKGKPKAAPIVTSRRPSKAAPGFVVNGSSKRSTAIPSPQALFDLCMEAMKISLGIGIAAREHKEETDARFAVLEEQVRSLQMDAPRGVPPVADSSAAEPLPVTATETEDEPNGGLDS